MSKGERERERSEWGRGWQQQVLKALGFYHAYSWESFTSELWEKVWKNYKKENTYTCRSVSSIRASCSVPEELWKGGLSYLIERPKSQSKARKGKKKNVSQWLPGEFRQMNPKIKLILNNRHLCEYILCNANINFHFFVLHRSLHLIKQILQMTKWAQNMTWSLSCSLWILIMCVDNWWTFQCDSRVLLSRFGCGFIYRSPKIKDLKNKYFSARTL